MEVQNMYDYAIRSFMMGAGFSLLLGLMDGISTYVLKDGQTLSAWTEGRVGGV